MRPVVHGAMGCGLKSFKLVWRCHQLLTGFLANYHLPFVSRQSDGQSENFHYYCNANDKDNDEMLPGAVHRSLGIYLTTQVKP